jgi:hypothetical protein
MWIEQPGDHVRTKVNLHFSIKVYSYGDSTGITPDFPFNQTNKYVLNQLKQ